MLFVTNIVVFVANWQLLTKNQILKTIKTMILVNFDKHSKLAQLCILEKKSPETPVYSLCFSDPKSLA
jgi:hypothetical protein